MRKECLKGQIVVIDLRKTGRAESVITAIGSVIRRLGLGGSGLLCSITGITDRSGCLIVAFGSEELDLIGDNFGYNALNTVFVGVGAGSYRANNSDFAALGKVLFAEICQLAPHDNRYKICVILSGRIFVIAGDGKSERRNGDSLGSLSQFGVFGKIAGKNCEIHKLFDAAPMDLTLGAPSPFKFFKISVIREAVPLRAGLQKSQSAWCLRLPLRQRGAQKGL